jgi:hypothetical protein
VLLTVEQCGFDAPDERVTVTHQDGTLDSYLVRTPHNGCTIGSTEIRAEEYRPLKAKLDALAK